jgi:hypothetical protein
MVGLGKRWYAGVRVVYAGSTVSLIDAEVEPGPILTDFLDTKMVEIGLRVERDSRDSTFYPTAGRASTSSCITTTPRTAVTSRLPEPG